MVINVLLKKLYKITKQTFYPLNNEVIKKKYFEIGDQDPQKHIN